MSDERLDQALVRRGFVRSRAQAKELLAAGTVSINGSVATKGSTKISPSDLVELSAEVDHYVGRAAHKLLAALDVFPEFAQRIPGRRCIDVGASTGGFTQVLLERGATSVVALDVGHGQLAASLQEDPRVRNLEGVNIRDIIPAHPLTEEPFDVIVSDLSFISLTLALPHLRFLLEATGQAVVLIKPQFEVGRERLGRTGVVASPQQREETIIRVTRCATDQGFKVLGLAWSPKVGSNGNHEYLLWMGGQGLSERLSPPQIRARAEELTSRDAS